MPGANALGLGDPVELDERCSPEAHSPDLRVIWAFFRALAVPRFPALFSSAGAGRESLGGSAEVHNGTSIP